MNREEYMRVRIKHIREDILERYQWREKVTLEGYIYIHIKNGIYGLKQAALLAYNDLKRNLEPYGYYPVVGTVGLWCHKTKPIRFCACVDDFGVKYFSKNDINRLLDSLSRNYKYTTDWEDHNYYGLAMDWNYDQGYVAISMPEYVQKV